MTMDSDSATNSPNKSGSHNPPRRADRWTTRRESSAWTSRPLPRATPRKPTLRSATSWPSTSRCIHRCRWRPNPGPISWRPVRPKAATNGLWAGGGKKKKRRGPDDGDIGFDFLEPGREYVATLYADAPDADYAENPEAYRIRSGRVTARNRLSVWMARGGGFAISLREAAPDDRRLPKLK